MKKVLLLTREMIPSAVLCAQKPLAELQERGEVEYRWCRNDKVCAADLAWAEIVVFVRGDRPMDVLLARTAKAAGKYLVYVLDDDLLAVPEHLSSGSFYAREEVRESIRTLMELCDLLLSPSPVLLEKYGSRFPRAARIEEPAPERPPHTKNRGVSVRIGFAGSVDRAGDVETLLSDALRRIKTEYGERVKVEFFGAKPDFADELGARCFPYCESYAEYTETMASLDWDIGLAPLPDTPFHRCKHYNKYIEYAPFGIAGVYSDTEIYRRAVRDGENGLLAGNTTEAWVAALRRLLDDGALRQRISEACRREAETLYSVERCADLWSEALHGVKGKGGTDTALRDFEREKRRVWWQDKRATLRRYGVRAPIILVRKITGKLGNRGK